MRDEHRPKQDLIHEVTALRKQVVDLKDSMVARRRVEDALRDAEASLRSLTDGAPVGLCLFRRDGTPLTTNCPFARMLGYESPAELMRIGGALGVFASREEQLRVLGSVSNGHRLTSGALFRCKDGEHRPFQVIAAVCPQEDTVSLVVINGNAPFPSHAA